MPSCEYNFFENIYPVQFWHYTTQSGDFKLTQKLHHYFDAINYAIEIDLFGIKW